MATEIDNIARALGRIPSGLFVVTVGGEDGTGYLGSFVMQLSLQPPIVGAGVSPRRPAFDLLARSENFCIHVIEAKQNQFLKHFGRGFAAGENAFQGLKMDFSEWAVPQILDLETRIIVKKTQVLDVGGDHKIAAGEVIAAHFPTERMPEPWVHLRKNGRDY